MPPPSRIYRSLTFHTFVACAAGLMAGHWAARPPVSFGGWFLLQAAGVLAQVVLATGRCVAFALILASIITGADTLESMRGVGRLSLKIGAWIAGSSLVAAMTGLSVGLFLSPWRGTPTATGPTLQLNTKLFVEAGYTGEPWIALVLVAVAIGVYRNQIEETRARLLMRFATATDETLTLLLAWSARIIPAAVFCVALATASQLTGDASESLRRLPGLLGALTVGWVIYGLFLLPLALLVLTRVNPWRYLAAVGPAVLAALAGGSPGQVFPLTLSRVRGQGGISNRVGSLTLGGCTALLRDGQAMGWALAGGWLIPGAGFSAQGVYILLLAWLLGCAAAANWGPAAPLLMLGLLAGPAETLAVRPLLALGVLSALIAVVGNAVSVFSQTCAAAVIARSEGETDLLPSLAPAAPFADVLLDSSAL